jgi:hypothetical protein
MIGKGTPALIPGFIRIVVAMVALWWAGATTRLKLR